MILLAGTFSQGAPLSVSDLLHIRETFGGKMRTRENQLRTNYSGADNA